jgi:hypothetical protein
LPNTVSNALSISQGNGVLRLRVIFSFTVKKILKHKEEMIIKHNRALIKAPRARDSPRVRGLVRADNFGVSEGF